MSPDEAGVLALLIIAAFGGGAVGYFIGFMNGALSGREGLLKDFNMSWDDYSTYLKKHNIRPH